MSNTQISNKQYKNKVQTYHAQDTIHTITHENGCKYHDFYIKNISFIHVRITQRVIDLIKLLFKVMCGLLWVLGIIIFYKNNKNLSDIILIFKTVIHNIIGLIVSHNPFTSDIFIHNTRFKISFITGTIMVVMTIPALCEIFIEDKIPHKITCLIIIIYFLPMLYFNYFASGFICKIPSAFIFYILFSIIANTILNCIIVSLIIFLIEFLYEKIFL